MVYLLTRNRFVWGVRFASITTLLVLALYVAYNSISPITANITVMKNNDFVTRETMPPADTADSMPPDKRGATVQQNCKNTAGMVSEPRLYASRRMLIYKPLNVTLCYVPKAGCTFWKRVFLSLQTFSGGITENAFTMTKNTAHYTKIGHLGDFKIERQANKYLFGSKRFMFVREPYSRLFSAYVDKFYLSDFWVHGKKMIKALRNVQNPRCVHDISFAEYLRMVVNKQLSESIGGGEEHWLPISQMCKVCEFNYQYVGKTENFDNDRLFVMRELGIASYVKSSISRDETVKDSIVQAVQTYWNQRVEPCMSKNAFRKRIYETFKIQGYVPMNSSVPILDTTTQNDFIDAVYNNYLQYRTTLAQWNKHRRNVVAQAYSQIPLKLKNAVASRFEWDFRLFGYDPRPKDIFPGV